MVNCNSYKINLCGVKDCTPDWHWETNGFNDYDLWAVFRGVGVLEVDGVEYEVKAGTCLLLPPNTKICGRHDPKNPLLTANVHFHFLQNDKQGISWANHHLHDFCDYDNNSICCLFSNNLK